MADQRDQGPDPFPQEQRGADSLFGLAARLKMTPGDPDPEAPAEISLTPGLPLLRPATDGPAGWLAVWRQWVAHLDAEFRFHDRADPDGQYHRLRRLSEERGEQIAATKRWLIHVGLLTALRNLHEPARRRIGSGTGSRFVEFIPAEEPVLGQLVWLAQEAKSLAGTILDVLAPKRDEPETWADATDPDSLADDQTRHPLDALIEEEERERQRARIYAIARGREAEKLEAYWRHWDLTQDYREALRRAAQDLGVAEGTVENVISDIIRRGRQVLGIDADVRI